MCFHSSIVQREMTSDWNFAFQELISDYEVAGILPDLLPSEKGLVETLSCSGLYDDLFPERPD
jgi:hypothetical protein